MRPSMRLPLREAKFVCSSCRTDAAPRISPLIQFRRYASDSSPGILERTRRKLWGTDTPPGQADPYSGSQIMPSSGLSPGEPTPANEQFNLEGQKQPEDIENLNWKDMPKIGYLQEQEWRLKGPNLEADNVKPWYANQEPLSHKEAVHQAVVEIGLAQIMGKDISQSDFNVFREKIHFDAHRKKIRACKIEGQAEQWGDRIRFSSEKSMHYLLRFTGGIETEAAYQARVQELKAAGKLENRLYRPNVKGELTSSLRSLPLTDGNIKFIFFSRLSELTGQRVSDSVLSATTIGGVLSAQKALLKKTNRLNPVLLHEKMDKNGAAQLSNVKIFDVRQTRHDNDEDLGRKKAIVTALYTNGLITKALRKKAPKTTT